MAKKKKKSSKKKTSKKAKTTKKTSKKSSKPKTKKQETFNVKKSIVYPTIALVVMIAAVLAISSLTGSDDPGTGTNTVTGEAVLDMYVMSQCPYGVQAESEAIKAIERFEGDVDYNIHYIVNSQGDTFQSLHGPAEVKENKRQLCIEELYPEKFHEYLFCFNENYKDGEGQYAKCTSELDMTIEEVASCVEDKGIELLKASEEKSKEAGASASPTIFLNGEPYNSGRSELDFARAICGELDYDHEGCADVPKPVSFTVTVLTDDECPACSTNQIVGATKQLFPGADYETVDVDSQEGQALVEEHDLTYLPAYFFPQKITETNTWETNDRIKSAFVESGDSYRLRDEATGASWFIDEEKQKEFFESIGVVKGDNKPQVDFFVMSYCPYGNQAEVALEPVFQKLQGKAEFNPRYVIYSDYGSGYPDYCLDEANELCSMHGVVELNQDIREVCVLKYEGEAAWFEFALAMNNECDSNNADTCWESVAESQGLDTAQISACEEEEGYSLMAADKELGDKLGVRGSPTIFVDGVQYSGARTAQGYLAAVCAAFDEKPSECDDVVQEPQQQPAPAGATC